MWAVRRKKSVTQKATELGYLGTLSLLSVEFILPKHMVSTLAIIMVYSLHCSTFLQISSLLGRVVLVCRGP